MTPRTPEHYAAQAARYREAAAKYREHAADPNRREESRRALIARAETLERVASEYYDRKAQS